jgi:hypothetical protein
MPTLYINLPRCDDRAPTRWHADARAAHEGDLIWHVFGSVAAPPVRSPRLSLRTNPSTRRKQL